MKKQITIFLVIIFIFGFSPIKFVEALDLTAKLKGKILLQVENHGEAWYVNIADGKRYYMANGTEAYNMMRNFGVGISNSNLKKLQNSKTQAKNQSGKIFLQVEDKGQAYYVNSDGTLYYLKDGEAAFNIMRNLGIGISNRDLEKIPDEFSSQSEIINRKKLTNDEIINKAKPAVVYIETDDGAGSGMIIDTNGYVLTNAHVVTGFNSVTIELSSGISKNASVVGRDENLDLALLKIDSGTFPKIIFGDSDIVKQGDEVFTLGFPFGIKGDVSFKEGTISRRLEGSDGKYFETSAEIHPGNSGGPLLNQYGEVIGINSAGLGQSINGIQVGETIKLAIPINIAKSSIPGLKNGLNAIVIPKNQQPSKAVTQLICNDIKNESSNFENKYNELSNKYIEILKLTLTVSSNTENMSNNPIEYFKTLFKNWTNIYYELSKKTKELKNNAEQISFPHANQDALLSIKTKFAAAAMYIDSFYDTRLETYRWVSENRYWDDYIKVKTNQMYAKDETLRQNSRDSYEATKTPYQIIKKGYTDLNTEYNCQ